MWFLFLVGLGEAASASSGPVVEELTFPRSEAYYQELEAQVIEERGHGLTLPETLWLRVKAEPFNIVATLIFLLAVLHTFLVGRFQKLAHHYEQEHARRVTEDARVYVDGKSPVSLRATFFHFLGEVEAVFGIWLIPLLVAMVLLLPGGWGTVAHYVDTRNFTEAIFVVVIMTVASSRPIIQLTEGVMSGVARLGQRSPGAWWFSILTIGPLLGSFITEPAAMTIAALLLGHQFYRLEPSARLKYATLGLLFVNVSVGGTLTHFAAPPVLMVAGSWDWNLPYMFTHFGWRAVVGIVVSNLIYFMLFRKEFAGLKARAASLEVEGQEGTPGQRVEPAPAWVIVCHVGFLAWTVLTLHHPPFFVGGFLFFLALAKATEHYQHSISLRGPLLVGFFLAGLVVHGGLQGWWIAPVLGSMSELPLFFASLGLSAFNDNAAITYLASQVPSFSPGEFVHGGWISKTGEALARAEGLEYAVVAGAVTGGGLTVIANAANPAGQSVLARYFRDGVAPLGLLVGALIPTAVVTICFLAISG